MKWKMQLSELSWSFVVAVSLAVSTAAQALDSSQAATLRADHDAVVSARQQFRSDRRSIRAANGFPAWGGGWRGRRRAFRRFERHHPFAARAGFRGGFRAGFRAGVRF